MLISLSCQVVVGIVTIVDKRVGVGLGLHEMEKSLRQKHFTDIFSPIEIFFMLNYQTQQGFSATLACEAVA